MHVVVAENLVIHSPGTLRERLLRLGLFKRKGRVPPGERRIIRFYLNEPDQIHLPRGLLPAVLKLVPGCTVVDRRVRLAPLDFRWRGELRPEQSQAALALARSAGGMLIGMPGAGKTNTGLGLVAVFRQPALWLVHTTDLAAQALERARQLYRLPPRAFGFIGDGQFQLGTHLTVGMVQTLAQNPELTAQVARRFGTVVFDECHHVPAMTIARVASQFGAFYRVGLTATPDRTDGLGPLARAIIGQEMATIDPKELLARGRILLPAVQIVPTEFRYGGPPNWASLQRARAGDAGRNQVIGQIVAEEARRGRRVIVLAELVDHARYLADMLRQRYGVPAVAVDGEVPPEARRRVFDWISKGRGVLVATKLADEGLDLPSLDCLVLAAPGRSAPRLKQQVGRVMRAFKGKSSAVVYDLADLHVPVLSDQATDRAQVYRSLGLRIDSAEPLLG